MSVDSKRRRHARGNVQVARRVLDKLHEKIKNRKISHNSPRKPRSKPPGGSSPRDYHPPPPASAYIAETVRRIELIDTTTLNVRFNFSEFRRRLTKLSRTGGGCRLVSDILGLVVRTGDTQEFFHTRFALQYLLDAAFKKRLHTFLTRHTLDSVNAGVANDEFAKPVGHAEYLKNARATFVTQVVAKLASAGFVHERFLVERAHVERSADDLQFLLRGLVALLALGAQP